MPSASHQVTIRRAPADAFAFIANGLKRHQEAAQGGAVQKTMDAEVAATETLKQVLESTPGT